MSVIQTIAQKQLSNANNQRQVEQSKEANQPISQQNIVYCYSWDQRLIVVNMQTQRIRNLAQFTQYLSKQLGGIPQEYLRLVQANKIITEFGQLNINYHVQVTLTNGLQGGKGGFGSLLRSMNPKKQQEQNFDSCRDLSGRRLRNTVNEQRLEEWKQKQEEEEKYVREENAEYEKNKKHLQQAIHANNFKVDEKYKQQVQKGAKSIADSIKQGLEIKKRDAKADGKQKKNLFNLNELLEDDGLISDQINQNGRKENGSKDKFDLKAFLKSSSIPGIKRQKHDNQPLENLQREDVKNQQSDLMVDDAEKEMIKPRFTLKAKSIK
eukprot:403375447